MPPWDFAFWAKREKKMTCQMSVLGERRLTKGGVGGGGVKKLPIVFNDTETSFCKARKNTYFCYKLL